MPTTGITDPAHFPGALEEDSALPVALIQDDDTFNAMVVNNTDAIAVEVAFDLSQLVEVTDRLVYRYGHYSKRPGLNK